MMLYYIEGIKDKEKRSKYRFKVTFNVIHPNDQWHMEEQYFNGRDEKTVKKQLDAFIAKRNYSKGYLIRNIYIVPNPEYVEPVKKVKKERTVSFEQLSFFDDDAILVQE